VDKQLLGGRSSRARRLSLGFCLRDQAPEVKHPVETEDRNVLGRASVSSRNRAIFAGFSCNNRVGLWLALEPPLVVDWGREVS